MNTLLKSLLAAVLLTGWGVLCVGVALIPDLGLRAFALALGALYASGAAGLAFGAFWARWFARGLGWWGAMAGGLLSLLTGFGWFLAVFGGTHLAVVLLLGDDVAARYDGRTEWREGLDDKTQQRIASLFSNLGSALPYVVFYALYPRGGAHAFVAWTAVSFAVVGLVGLARLRTAGLLAAAAFAAIALFLGTSMLGGAVDPLLLGIGGLVAWRIRDFVPAVVRWLR